MLHPDIRRLQKVKPSSRFEESGFWLLMLALAFVVFWLTPIGSRIGHDLKIVAANTYSTNPSKQTLVGDISHESKAYVQMLKRGTTIVSLQHARTHAVDTGGSELGNSVNGMLDQANSAAASSTG